MEEIITEKTCWPMPVVGGVGLAGVCVPENWTNEQVKAFADEANPCGTQHGWHVRDQAQHDKDRLSNTVAKASKAAVAFKERIPCLGRKGFVHIMLDA